jgi:ABC-type sugar transport system substrate-binding protein
LTDNIIIGLKSKKDARVRARTEETQETLMTNMTRRAALLSTVAIAAAFATSALAQGLPPLKQKPTYKVGFAQTESNNPWRLAQTASMKAEAEKLGWQLVYTDAAGSAAKQVADVNSMIAQGVDVIFLSPREEKPLIPAVMAAKKAGIPLFLIDRSVDAKLAKAGQDYVAFIGSDFVLEGKQAGEWLAKATNGKATILEIEGSTGSSPANDRKTGFDAVIAQHPDMKIIASQTGNFNRVEGRQTAEALLQAHPEANVIYAHNDEMAIGAIAAIEAAGKKPGKDIIVVSIDGEKDGLQAIIDGKMGATVECNPRFGPAAFKAAMDYAKGEKIPPIMTNKDNFYDSSNAAASIAGSY